LVLAAALVICSFTAFAHAQSPDDCVSLTGRVFSVVKDTDSGSETFTYFREAGSSRAYQLETPIAPDGALVRVDVSIAGDRATLCGGAVRVVEPAGIGVDAIAGDARRVVVLLVSFADAALSTRCTPSAVQQTLYTDPTSMAAYYTEATFGAIAFDPDVDGNGAPDVFGPYKIASTTGTECSIYVMAQQADEAATAAGVDLSRYGYRIYVTPDQANCGNLGTLGC
jgi:hypothetical protein